MKKLNVLLLFGGQSTEHTVSNVSASNVYSLLNLDKYNVYRVGITANGEWFLFEGSKEEMKDGSWEKMKLKRAFLSPDTVSGLVILDGESTEFVNIDVVFPVLHGILGEDGSVQGLSSLAKIPCVGPDMLSSAICMDKPTAKILFKHYNIPQADWITVFSPELNDIEKTVSKIEEKFDYPVFIKPANAGSSVGIGKSHNNRELKTDLINASKVDSKILVEEFIDAREVECAVLGNGEDVLVSMPGEIIPAKNFYDFEAKYESDSKLLIPALLSEEQANEVRETAKRAYISLGLSGMSRVDFFVHKKTGKLYLNEINTIPGFTGISMYPMLMEKSGIPGGELVDRLIDCAISSFAGISEDK